MILLESPPSAVLSCSLLNYADDGTPDGVFLNSCEHISCKLMTATLSSTSTPRSCTSHVHQINGMAPSTVQCHYDDCLQRSNGSSSPWLPLWTHLKLCLRWTVAEPMSESAVVCLIQISQLPWRGGANKWSLGSSSLGQTSCRALFDS